MGELAEKNILITGGNSGIGLAAAQEFDREGARVAICGLNERSLQATKKTLGAGSLAVRADVSNLSDLDTMFATIKREFGHLDGVFVNAGYSEFLPFEEVTEQSFEKVIAVNFKGAYFTVQKALPLLRQGSSVIINASVGARKGWPTTSTVSTCKAAVVHLAHILSAELVARGFRVNTQKPGPTDTAMFGRFPGEEQGEAVKGVLRTNNPSKRMADPLEIAKLSLPRVGRFCVRRRGRLLDRRRGHSHFGRGRLSLVVESGDFKTKGKLKMKTKLQVSKNVTMNKPDEKGQGMKVRTVVTGHDAKGRAVFVRDEQVDGTPIPGIGELAFLWNADEPATYPNAGNNPAAPGIFPPVGGIRYIIGTYLPGVIAPEPTPEMHLEDGDAPGGANDGFHRTDTTDFGVLISGKMALKLDDGAEVVLSPGDVLIENGTRHRWRVVGHVPATLASFITGARRR